MKMTFPDIFLQWDRASMAHFFKCTGLIRQMHLAGQRVDLGLLTEHVQLSIAVVALVLAAAVHRVVGELAARSGGVQIGKGNFANMVTHNVILAFRNFLS